MAEVSPNSNQKKESNSALGNIFSNQILSIQNKQKEVDNQNIILIQQQESTLSLFNTSIQSLRTDIGKLSTGLSNIAFLLQKDNLEDQSRIRQQQERERILAEQEVRIGKENELEQKIQAAVAQPVERLAPKMENTFSGIKSALGILLFGWLTNQVVQSIINSEEKTTFNFNSIKFNIIKNVGIGIGGLDAIRNGFSVFKNTLGTISSKLVEILPKPLRDLFSNNGESQPPSQPPSQPSTPSISPGQAGAPPPTGVTRNEVSQITDTRNPSKLIIGSGHVDTPGQPGSGSGTADPTTGVRESAATQHVLRALQSLISSDPILKDRIGFASFDDNNFATNNRDRYTNRGMQFLELHFDQYGGGGRSGLIPSRNAREGVTGNTGTSGFDVALSAAFGNYGRNFKEGDLGIPDTGGSILELGAIDSNKELLNEVKGGKMGPETTKMVQYLYQALRQGAQLEGWNNSQVQPTPSTPTPAGAGTSQISEERQKQFEMAWNYRNNPMARGRIEGAWNNLSAEEQQQAIQWARAKGYNWDEMRLTPKTQTQQAPQTIQPSPAQITTPPQPPQQVGSLPEPQPVITMISSPNANQQPAPPPITSGPITDVPLIRSSNPDNFYVLYSQFNYNVVM